MPPAFRLLRDVWSFLLNPDPRKCRVGWHAWDKRDIEIRDYGDKRTCRFCGLAEYLHPDMGGVSTGTWEPYPYPEPGAPHPPQHADTREHTFPQDDRP